tara:strand:+ start:1940 stop:3700 length:1761 start_codon:yes stop_codon:yes gene_type:complete
MNGAELAIISSKFQGVCQQMANTLMRTGRSGVLNTAHDFSCCILDSNNLFITADESLPVHVLSGPDLMAKNIDKFHPVKKRGDAFLINSPYHGGSHAADHTIIVPIIDDKGVHQFSVCAKAHQADIGNSKPTTYMADVEDVFEEGALLFPGTKIQENYSDIQDIIRMCEIRFRAPEQWKGDYLAMIGAVRIGERELLNMGSEIGWENLNQFVKSWFDYSEKRMRAAIKKIPSGNVTITTKHDPFPNLPKEGLKIKVNVNIDNVSGLIKVDLRDNPDNIPCGLNLTEATSRSGVMTGIFNSIDHTVPPNSGSFRCVEILLRKGCIVGIPEHPYSCSLATSNVCDRLENAVVQAFAQMGEGFGMAECGSLLPPATGVISGHDPRNNKYFVNEIFLFHTAAGASPEADGWLTLTGMGSAGLCLLDSVELDELRFPMKVYKQEIYINSEGAGKRRGSPGAYVEFGPLGSNMKVAYASDGSYFPAAGVRGGGNASKAKQYKIDKFGKKVNLPIVHEVELLENERIVSITQPGGGYGPPYERELLRVQKDFLEGWITKKRAYEVYGVKFNNKGEINKYETSIKRKFLKKKYN